MRLLVLRLLLLAVFFNTAIGMPLHGATHIRQAAAGPAQAFVGLNGCEDDALTGQAGQRGQAGEKAEVVEAAEAVCVWCMGRSEEHTSELQSPDHLVCRLLLEKKKKMYSKHLLNKNQQEGDQITNRRAKACIPRML